MRRLFYLGLWVNEEGYCEMGLSKPEVIKKEAFKKLKSLREDVEERINDLDTRMRLGVK